MYQFSSWCFLCANTDNVSFEIKSLQQELQEKISEFSIVNYNIPHCPSKICNMCHIFIGNLIILPKRYEKVEKLYIELLKDKSKNIMELKKKHDLLDDIRSSYADLKLTEDSIISENIVITEIVDIPMIPESPEPPSPKKHRAILNSVKTSIVPNISSSPLPSTTQKNKPKLLNPTIYPQIERKSRLDLLTCDKCSHSTSTKFALEKHMEIHAKNEKLFECEVCSKKFSKKQILLSHELTHKMSTDRKTFQCSECGKHLSSQTAVNNHLKWYHEKREYKCEICSKDFATKGSLSEHLHVHSKLKSYVCPICKKEYKTASTLSNHLDTHSNTVYECFQCGMKLNSKRTLRQHEKVHSNAVAHTCDICGAKFKRTKAFKEHLITHANIRPYTCDYCPKTFTNGPNCRKHLREIHPEELKEAEKIGTPKKSVKLPRIEELLKMTNASKTSLKE